jgi:hypothetical protein
VDLKRHGDVIDVQGSLRYCHHQIESAVVTEVNWVNVDVEENNRPQPAKTFVAVNQSVAANDRVEERSGFARDARVSLGPENARSGSGTSGLQNAEITYRPHVDSLDEPQQIFKV